MEKRVRGNPMHFQWCSSPDEKCNWWLDKWNTVVLHDFVISCMCILINKSSVSNEQKKVFFFLYSCSFQSVYSIAHIRYHSNMQFKVLKYSFTLASIFCFFGIAITTVSLSRQCNFHENGHMSCMFYPFNFKIVRLLFLLTLRLNWHRL